MALSARLLLGLALLAALLAVVLQLYHLRKQRLWTMEELAVYNGTDESLPILLGILGSVFDVTKGKSNYGPGGGYHHFAGRDASRAFVSGNFTDITKHCFVGPLSLPAKHQQHTSTYENRSRKGTL